MALLIAFSATGCAGSGMPNGAGPESDRDAGRGTSEVDAAKVPDPLSLRVPPLGVGSWSMLVEQAWELAPGTEGYWCKRVEAVEDAWIVGIRAVAPPGTHHTTLGKDSGGPNGAFQCGGFSTGTDLLFGSGVGTDTTVLPEGVAIKVAAGEQLLLNLHVYNTGIEDLAGTSGIEVLAMRREDVVHEAGFVLAGLAGGLTVPPGESSQTGTCTIPSDVVLLSIGAHMHTYGVHQRVTAYPLQDAPTVLTDAAYDFNEQSGVWLDPPFSLRAGGEIEVSCTYRNDTARVLGFGEGTDDEMCYAGVYHYPRFQTGSSCVR
jgi:hypothetical protein